MELDACSEFEYVTLNYCWGKSGNSRALQENLVSHKAGMPIHDLSPTLRHAILVVRRLGFQYLWVDSLCIIQQSKQDWDIESGRMANIYQNSVLTIAAPQAQSSMEGILPDRTDRQRRLKNKRPRKKGAVVH